MIRPRGFNLLEDKIPAGSGSMVLEWIQKDPVNLVMNRPRLTKLGDFRPGQNGKPPRITVNSDLHPVEFLITLAHEFAHAENFRIHGKRVKPHGKEWKLAFRNKLSQLIGSGIFDERYEKAIHNCFFRRERLATSSCSFLKRLYDDESGGVRAIRIEDLPRGAVFTTTNGKVLIKGDKIRTRYKCREVSTNRIYTVHPMAEISEFKAP